MTNRYLAGAALAAGTLLVAAGTASADPPGARFSAFIRAEVTKTHYDGSTNDLLTAGLGAAGLATPGLAAPGERLAPVDPLTPTVEELRRLAIYNNYRALVDTSRNGGYGVFYGPQVSLDGGEMPNDGRIPGTEYLALLDSPGGSSRLTVMVQVPDSFDPTRPCIVTATSSGSRGVYGAIGTAGEWGLKKGCAVAYNDKGTGIGFHDLDRNRTYTFEGQFVDAATAGREANFIVPTPPDKLAEFTAGTPHRIAVKHAHSRQNPEQHWGDDTLHAVAFAFLVLNRQFADSDGVTLIAPHNTIVIGSSVSNGGGAALRAAERDRFGLIDGVAVSEPQINPVRDRRFVIQSGGTDLVEHGLPLADYMSLYHVYGGCAAVGLTDAPSNLAPSPERCQALHEKGLLSAGTPDEQAEEARNILHEAGILPEQDLLLPSYWTFYAYQAVAVLYPQAYGRFDVTDRLCDYSYAATSAGVPDVLPEAAGQLAFATGNGIPPTAGVNLINDRVAGGLETRASTPDQNLDGAICLRNLWEGRDIVTGAKLRGEQRAAHSRIRSGVDRILANARLRGKPTIIVNGRADALVAPNHASRSYYGSVLANGGGASTRYYEITNAHHLDILNALPGFDALYIPLQYYFFQAMNLMYDHLATGAELPSSQVVRAQPRGVVDGDVPPLTGVNLPDIATAPGDDAITFTGDALVIPQ